MSFLKAHRDLRPWMAYAVLLVGLLMIVMAFIIAGVPIKWSHTPWGLLGAMGAFAVGFAIAVLRTINRATDQYTELDDE